MDSSQAQMYTSMSVVKGYGDERSSRRLMRGVEEKMRRREGMRGIGRIREREKERERERGVEEDVEGRRGEELRSVPQCTLTVLSPLCSQFREYRLKELPSKIIPQFGNPTTSPMQPSLPSCVTLVT